MEHSGLIRSRWLALLEVVVRPCFFLLSGTLNHYRIDLELPKRGAGSLALKNREQRKFHTEAATPAFLARDLNFGVMRGTDRLDDGEPQASSAAGA